MIDKKELIRQRDKAFEDLEISIREQIATKDKLVLAERKLVAVSEELMEWIDEFEDVDCELCANIPCDHTKEVCRNCDGGTNFKCRPVIKIAREELGK